MNSTVNRQPDFDKSQGLKALVGGMRLFLEELHRWLELLFDKELPRQRMTPRSGDRLRALSYRAFSKAFWPFACAHNPPHKG